jgi:hypothetical protein
VRKIVNEEKNGLVCVHALAWMHTILLNECLGEDAQTRLDTVDFTYEKMKNLMTLLIEREKSERHSP